MTVEARERHQQVIEDLLHLRPRQAVLDGAQDHRVIGARHVRADEQFLEQLLRGAKPRVLDLDIAIGVVGVPYRVPHEVDQAPRQIVDTHRTPHVKHEHIATLGHGTCLQHQLPSLGYGHEVADDVPVGDRDRTAATDLLLKQRHDRTRGSQHVAEAHHAEARLGGPLLQRLQDELRQAFGGAHDVRRVDRLVGRDQHEGFNPGLERRFRGVPGADHVVVNAFDHVVLDDRHVLVSGGVVDGLHAERGQDLAHPVPVMRIAQERHDLHRQLLMRRDFLQLALDVVQRQLRHLEQHQAAGAQADDLPAQFRADGPAGPGDQDALAADA